MTDLQTIRTRGWVISMAEAYLWACDLFRCDPSESVVDWLMVRAIVVERPQ